MCSVQCNMCFNLMAKIVFLLDERRICRLTSVSQKSTLRCHMRSFSLSLSHETAIPTAPGQLLSYEQSFQSEPLMLETPPRAFIGLLLASKPNETPLTNTSSFMWILKPTWFTSGDLSGDNAVRGKRDFFSSKKKKKFFICSSASKIHFDSVLWDNKLEGYWTCYKQCTCHICEHWVWNVTQCRRKKKGFFNKRKEHCWKQKETTALEKVSLSHEFVLVCICHSCSLVITHASGNEAYEKDAAQNAACTEYKKIRKKFSRAWTNEWGGLWHLRMMWCYC